MARELNYSPRLKEAMEEVKVILKRYDIAGVIVLHEPGFAEHIIKTDPGYSCARLVNGGMRVTATQEKYGEKRGKVMDDTFNMFQLLAEVSGKCSLLLIDVEEQMTKAIKEKGGEIFETNPPPFSGQEKKTIPKTPKDIIFTVEHQYKLYLERVALQEELMHPTQAVQLRQTFYGAWGQQLLLMRNEVAEFEEEVGVRIMQAMLDEVRDYFTKNA